MARKSTIKLLLVNESDNEGERLVSLFRNAGRVARVSRASDAEELHAFLESKTWDLLIANDKHPEIAVEQCLQQLDKTKIDLPTIIIRDQDQDAALAAGACDVVASDQDARLIHAAFRELRNLEQRRQLITTQAKLEDAEERCSLLMSESQDALAYVADGMLISSNQAFATCFGYDSPDDLDCAPVIDLIEEGDHEKFKGLLKTQLSQESGTTDFNIDGLKQSGDTFDTAMQLSNAVLDDEACIQITIKDSAASASSSNISADHDPATGLYSHDYFLSQLDSCIKQAVAGVNRSILLFIGIDKFTAIRSKQGITHSHNIVLNIANFIQQQAENVDCLAHFCDDGFTALLENCSTAKALDYAETLCQQLEQHIIEIDNQSIQCTASIGVLEVDGQRDDANELIDLAFNTAEQLRTEKDNEGVGNGALLHVAVRKKKSLGNASGDEELDKFLEEALEDGQFTLSFQPVVSLRGSSGEHYEVRAIMTDENDEELHASQYMDNINFGGVNTRLDRWIILEATKKLASQIEKGQPTKLFINLTANALQDETLIPWISVALKAGNLPPDALIFQFIETDISKYLKPAKAFSDAITDIGCRIAIASFGKSNDPFKVLQHVQASHVKIAKQFTAALQSGGDTQALKAMVSSINEKQAKAIISHVENAAALAQLWQIGVDYIQGLYLAGPSSDMDYEFTDIA